MGMIQYRSADEKLWLYSEWGAMHHEGAKYRGVWTGAYELSAPAGECPEWEFERMCASIETLTREQMAERYPDAPKIDLDATNFEVPDMIIKGKADQ